MCPLRSGFPDLGPDPDFFLKSSPDLLSKSGFLALDVESRQFDVTLASDEGQLAGHTIICHVSECPSSGTRYFTKRKDTMVLKGTFGTSVGFGNV